MQDFQSHDLVIEPFRRGDEVTIQEIFDALSPEARYHRFMQAMPVLKPNLRRLLAAVDGDKHQAWVARIAHRPVGIVRTIIDQTGELELAVSVVDAASRRGIGRRLTEVALDAAGRAGVDDVIVMIHPQNVPSMAMFRSMGASFRLEFGLMIGRVPTRSAAVAA